MENIPTTASQRPITLDSCSICLNDLNSSSRKAELICSHIFHINCLRNWMDLGRTSCPLCRRYIYPAEREIWHRNHGWIRVDYRRRQEVHVREINIQPPHMKGAGFALFLLCLFNFITIAWALHRCQANKRKYGKHFIKYS